MLGCDIYHNDVTLHAEDITCPACGCLILSLPQVGLGYVRKNFSYG